MPESPPLRDSSTGFLVKAAATGFMVQAVTALVNGKSLWITVGCIVVAIVLYVSWDKWPEIRKHVGPRAVVALPKVGIVALIIVLGYFGLSALLYITQLRTDLDSYAMPRTLTVKQANDLVNYLSTKESHAVAIGADPLDAEAVQYAANIFAALSRTNWDAKGVVSVPRPSFEGVEVMVEWPGPVGAPDDPKHPAADRILTEAFSRVVGTPIAEGALYNKPEYKVSIIVGKRPLRIPSEGRFAKWLVRLEY